MKLLAFDIGNGSVKYARFAEGRRASRASRVSRVSRVEGGRLAPDADFEDFRGETAAAVSVNPPVLESLRLAVPGLRVVGEDLPVPIPVHYEPPSACGLDRVMGVVAALQRRPQARAVLVLDAGTCLTATLGLRDRGVVGGAILPGPELMAGALAGGTAALPLVDPAPPAHPLGRSTEDSIRAGIEAALHGAVRDLIGRARRQVGDGLDVVAAGRGAGPLAAACPEIDALHPFATLWGVYWAVRMCSTA